MFYFLLYYLLMVGYGKNNPTGGHSKIASYIPFPINHFDFNAFFKKVIGTTIALASLNLVKAQGVIDLH
jgi:hypothetical protein